MFLFWFRRSSSSSSRTTSIILSFSNKVLGKARAWSFLPSRFTPHTRSPTTCIQTTRKNFLLFFFFGFLFHSLPLLQFTPGIRPPRTLTYIFTAVDRSGKIIYGVENPRCTFLCWEQRVVMVMVAVAGRFNSARTTVRVLPHTNAATTAIYYCWRRRETTKSWAGERETKRERRRRRRKDVKLWTLWAYMHFSYP